MLLSPYATLGDRLRIGVLIGWCALVLAFLVLPIFVPVPLSVNSEAFFTFPLAVYALATLALARVTQFELFAVAGTVLVAGLTGFWVVVATRTAQGAADRRLFYAPCLHTPHPRAQFQADAV
ncbi:MAG: hypothetical protein J0H99_07010 [Rhodospirillales bacterium]|nr:hypothetical protein [Rhodospirillales bacterium]